MAELFTLPARATDSNGNNLSGAKLYFYITGTTTPQDVYSDAALNTSLGAVVTADSGGKFVGIYLDPLLTYRAVLKTSDGASTIYDLDPIGSGGSAGDIQFTPSGTGAVIRTVQAKLRELPSAADFDTLANAKTAAGVKPLLDASNGRIWHFGVTSPTFDEATNALGRGIAFDNNGSTVTIAAGKQWNFTGIRNGGSDINFTIGAGSEVAGHAFYMRSLVGSSASSNLYGVTGYVANAGPGTTKAFYGRALALSGATGTVIGGVFRAQLDTGSSAANSYALQIGHAGDVAKVLSGVVLIDTEAASGQAVYGFLSANTMSYTTAFIRACTGGGGKFLQWQASGGGIDLFHVDQLGMIYTYSQAGNTKMVDLQNGGRINFTATAATATAGAGTLPAAPDQFIKILVGGVEKLLPVYNP